MTIVFLWLLVNALMMQHGEVGCYWDKSGVLAWCGHAGRVTITFIVSMETVWGDLILH